MNEEQTQNDELRRAALAARERSRALRAVMESRSLHDIRQHAARPQPTPEHYHILYHVPSENVVIPHYGEVFATQREVYLRMQEMGLASEPNTEWYDEGLVGIETTLHGRSGLWWLILEPARCVRSQCRRNLPRDFVKRRLVLLQNESALPVIRGR